MNRMGAVLSGLGVGALIMYLFDPNRGNRRRAMIRDKALSMRNQTQRTLGAKSRDLSNRARGLMHGTSNLLKGRRRARINEQTGLGEDEPAS